MYGHDDCCDLSLDCYLGRNLSKVITREWWKMHAMPCPCHGFVTWRLLLRRGAGHFAPSGDSRDARSGDGWPVEQSVQSVTRLVTIRSVARSRACAAIRQVKIGTKKIGKEPFSEHAWPELRRRAWETGRLRGRCAIGRHLFSAKGACTDGRYMRARWAHDGIVTFAFLQRR